MELKPIDLMMARVENYGAESDTVLFHELLYAAEFMIKLTTAAFVSAIQNDREDNRYRIIHGLVRANGIGEWSTKLDETLSGAASQQLADVAKQDRMIFNERVGKDRWQFDAVESLREALKLLQSSAQPVGDKTTLRAWFSTFPEIRNRTRGHGAITPSTCAKVVPILKHSVDLIRMHNPIFQRPWAYLHRNLSGKYKVVAIANDQTAFSKLATSAAIKGENYPNGVYIDFGSFHRVELLKTDLDLSDFYVPNGAFDAKGFELHSPITDSRLEGDSSLYTRTAGERPPSETHGGQVLDVVGNVHTNIPPVPPAYIQRQQLEDSLLKIVVNDRHPMITLVGRGGIGKTSLALSVLHKVSDTDRFDVILWFSARDIDLTTSGPKAVRPQVLTEHDIANDFRNLTLALYQNPEAEKSAVTAMASHLHSSPLGKILFVVDNFETLRNPVDLFQWLDTNIRLPNKVMITSRFRDFKADYPIEVGGMQQLEAEVLVMRTASILNIRGSVSNSYRNQVIEESGGHPYVIKIILGEAADSKTFSRPRNIIAKKEDLLEALFERTFANLTPIATRIFLTLSSWRSLVPQIALEAVLLRHPIEHGDPESGVDELLRMSLIERVTAPDQADFLSVPLTAALFGSKKLSTSPNRALIEEDVAFLQEVGSTSAGSLKEGIRPRVTTFFRRAARQIADKAVTLDDMRRVLEFLAQHHAPAWLLLADLQEEQGASTSDQAANYIRRFIESGSMSDEAHEAWKRLIRLYRVQDNVVGACSAFLEAASLEAPALNEISSMMNWVNNKRMMLDTMDVLERRAVLQPLAKLMDKYLDEALATDLSRLSWLNLHFDNEPRAKLLAELGLRKEPGNFHCQRLAAKFSI